MKNSFLNITTAICFGLASMTNVSADTLDFTEVGLGSSGLVNSTTIHLSNATLTSHDVDFYIGAPRSFGETNNLGIVCGAEAEGSCEADWEIDFSSTINGLMMSAFAIDAGDSVEVSAFLAGSLLGSMTVTTATTLDFSSFGLIDSLFFDDSSTGAGIGFGDFEFNVSSVPVPTSALLFIPALLGFIGLRRKACNTIV